jgi:hypothetical protein
VSGTNPQTKRTSETLDTNNLGRNKVKRRLEGLKTRCFIIIVEVLVHKDQDWQQRPQLLVMKY